MRDEAADSADAADEESASIPATRLMRADRALTEQVIVSCSPGMNSKSDRNALLECRAHQFHGVLARPFRRPRDRAELASGRIDEQCGRHSGGATYHLQVLKHLGAGIGIIGEPADADLLEPGARLVRIAGADAGGGHLEAGPAELAFERIKGRHLLAAGHAPGGPEVEQDRAPA